MQHGHSSSGVNHVDDETVGMKRLRQQGPEQMAAKLQEIGIMVGQGMLMSEAIRRAGVAGSTYYKWRAANQRVRNARDDMSQTQRMQTLMVENTRLRQAVADLTIEKQALKEVALKGD